MEPKADLKSDGVVQFEPKREYQRPILVTFGRIAALTRSATCSTQSDGVTLASCGPGNMAMQSSDRNVKENVVRVASHPLGIGLYLFDYKPAFRSQWGHGRQFGVMADEVETVMPEAVSVHPDGYKLVNYALLGITRFLQ
jgi:hypothetical protein